MYALLLRFQIDAALINKRARPPKLTNFSEPCSLVATAIGSGDKAYEHRNNAAGMFAPVKNAARNDPISLASKRLCRQKVIERMIPQIKNPL